MGQTERGENPVRWRLQKALRGADDFGTTPPIVKRRIRVPGQERLSSEAGRPKNHRAPRARDPGPPGIRLHRPDPLGLAGEVGLPGRQHPGRRLDDPRRPGRADGSLLPLHPSPADRDQPLPRPARLGADGAGAIPRPSGRADLALPAGEQPPHGPPPGHHSRDHGPPARQHAPRARRHPVPLRPADEDAEEPRAVRAHAPGSERRDQATS